LTRPSSISPAASKEEAEDQALTRRAGVVALGTLVSRLLGLVRDQAMAAVFSRAVTDAFFVAFTIPNVLRQLLAEGAVNSALLPVLAKTRETAGESEARRFFRAARGLSLCVLLGVSVAGILAAPALVELFASGYSAVPGQTARTVELTRWVFPYIFFMGTAALGAAALNSCGRFVATSLAPGLLNVAFIAFTFTLPPVLLAHGLEPGLALGLAVLVGGVLQVVAQWPSLRRIGYLEAPSFEFAHPGVREMLGRMLPVLLGTGVYYIDVVLARRFLSELGLGAQSYFSWALRLCDFPQGIFVMALQTAALPSLSKLAARSAWDELARTYAFGMRLTLFAAIGATALFVGLAEPLVVLLFQRGEFDALAARETARALVAQGAGIWLVAGARQLTSTYYALGDTRTPALVAGLDLLVFIGLSLAWREPFGHVGIGMAVTGASFTQLLLLWLGLSRRRELELRLREIASSAARTLLASLSAIAVARVVASSLTPEVQPARALQLALPGLCGSICFVLVFLLVCRLLKSPELALLTELVARRLGRGKKDPA
jgi:putative peptidoglycan lipid II flippase